MDGESPKDEVNAAKQKTSKRRKGDAKSEADKHEEVPIDENLIERSLEQNNHLI